MTDDKNLIIPCGAGSFTISLEDGKVTLLGCTLAESERAFWDAVQAIRLVRDRGIEDSITLRKSR